MATVMGDLYADSSRFHTMIGGPSVQHPLPHESHFSTRSVSRSRDRDTPTPTHHPRTAPSPRRQGSAALSNSAYPSHVRRERDEAVPDTSAKDTPVSRPAAGRGSGGASRFPSPPSSSSPSESSSSDALPQNGLYIPVYSTRNFSTAEPPLSSASSVSSTSTDATIVPERAMPSPDSDGGPRWASSGDTPSLGADFAGESGSPVQTQTTIRVRDLAHIQALAKADLLTATGPGILNDPPLQQMKYEISGMPIGDVIEMVAALLTKITTTNDLQHDTLNRHQQKQSQSAGMGSSSSGSEGPGGSPLSSSVLAFHGKNVPAITILSYLSRIHKYCPTTYEVFLSLLVYFDRMTERVNDMVVKSEEARRVQLLLAAQAAGPSGSSSGPLFRDPDTVMRDDGSETGDETDSDLADDDDDEVDQAGGSKEAAKAPVLPSASIPSAQATYFVVDSFNIHRLIIAGVTCASKFFSDVFYTNSRYAKVGGLPLAELNHLELQFLLLNDFRLAVAVEDLEAYATMLVEFYAREVVAQRSRPVAGVD